MIGVGTSVEEWKGGERKTARQREENRWEITHVQFKAAFIVQFDCGILLSFLLPTFT